MQMVRTDYYFLSAAGQFPKKKSCTEKTAEKNNRAREATIRKKEQVLSNVIILIFHVKNIPAQANAHQKKNYARP